MQSVWKCFPAKRLPLSLIGITTQQVSSRPAHTVHIYAFIDSVREARIGVRTVVHIPHADSISNTGSRELISQRESVEASRLPASASMTSCASSASAASTVAGQRDVIFAMFHYATDDFIHGMMTNGRGPIAIHQPLLLQLLQPYEMTRPRARTLSRLNQLDSPSTGSESCFFCMLTPSQFVFNSVFPFFLPSFRPSVRVSRRITDAQTPPSGVLAQQQTSLKKIDGKWRRRLWMKRWDNNVVLAVDVRSLEVVVLAPRVVSKRLSNPRHQHAGVDEIHNLQIDGRTHRLC